LSQFGTLGLLDRPPLFLVAAATAAEVVVVGGRLDARLGVSRSGREFATPSSIIITGILFIYLFLPRFQIQQHTHTPNASQTATPRVTSHAVKPRSALLPHTFKTEK
jgi:hypothetical protein